MTWEDVAEMYDRLDRLQERCDDMLDRLDLCACIDNLMEQETLLAALAPTATKH